MTRLERTSHRPIYLLRGCPTCGGDLILEEDLADGTRGHSYHCLLCGRSYTRGLDGVQSTTHPAPAGRRTYD
jgi:hypothetical protein